jgi:hypothetical protein
MRAAVGALLAALMLAGVVRAQAPPDVPAALRPPAGEHLILKAHATGAQVYSCTQGEQGRWQWTLKGPDAQLHDVHGALIGRHYAGPAWSYRDGSAVTGKVVAHQDAPRPDAVAWLLLSAAGHAGNGLLTSVSSIQRLNTQGGQPPPATQCDASRPNAEARTPYSADYYFYAPQPAGH